MFFDRSIPFDRALLPFFALLLELSLDASCVSRPPREYQVDVGKNITLPCELTQDVIWVFRNQNITGRHRMNENKSLSLTFADANDAGVYSCRVDGENGANETQEENSHLIVRTPPPPLVNVSVHLTTIVGLVLWKVKGDGGYPIVNFTAEFREREPPENGSEPELWQPISPNHITPNARQIDVYHLMPNTSYRFRVWATNQLGRSTPVEVFGRTQISDTDRELARVFLTDLKNFDPLWWVAAVSIVMGTLCVLTFGTCLLLYRECRIPSDSDEEQDAMELVPNIILNPGFVDGQSPPTTVTIRSNCKYARANGSAEPRKV